MVPLGIAHSQFLSWSEDDQDKALAWMRLRASTCGLCGTRQEEWDEDPFAYVGHSWRCPGCEVTEREKANIPEDAGHGIHVGIIPRSHAEQQQSPPRR